MNKIVSISIYIERIFTPRGLAGSMKDISIVNKVNFKAKVNWKLQKGVAQRVEEKPRLQDKL